MSAPTASQRPDCSCCFSRGCGASEGRTGGTALSALPWRLRVLVPHVGSINAGPEEPVLGLRLPVLFWITSMYIYASFSFGSPETLHSLALPGRRRDQLLTVSTPPGPWGLKSRRPGLVSVTQTLVKENNFKGPIYSWQITR